jgi:hypothetical protein
MEIEKLNPAPTLMIEHLNEQQLIQGLEFIFTQAAALGITFTGATHHASTLSARPVCLARQAYLACARRASCYGSMLG